MLFKLARFRMGAYLDLGFWTVFTKGPAKISMQNQFWKWIDSGMFFFSFIRGLLSHDIFEGLRVLLVDKAWCHVNIAQGEPVTAVRCSFIPTVCLPGDILPSRFRSDSKRKTLAASYCTGHRLHAGNGYSMTIRVESMCIWD